MDLSLETLLIYVFSCKLRILIAFFIYLWVGNLFNSYPFLKKVLKSSLLNFVPSLNALFLAVTRYLTDIRFMVLIRIKYTQSYGTH